MRTLLACTCLTSVALLASVANAETVISTKVTDRVKTSTVKPGVADDIKIGTAGSVVPTGSGAAVTIDSNHKVSNEGTIAISDVNDATGILTGAGVTGAITNSGKIELLESYVATDGDKDGDLDGAFATGARRFGIRLAPGGTFNGSVLNSGSIAVEGNDSVGIAADSRLAGSLTSSGTIAVTGDRAVGVRAQEVTGDVKLSGGVAVQGADATAVSLDGNIGGALIVQGSLSATGYRSSVLPADSSKLDADDLLQGGPALRVGGSVAKGILFDAPPPDTKPDDKDEDKDGIDDAKEGTAAVTAFGSAAAVQVGTTGQAITVGAVPGQTHGIVVNGAIHGRGVYTGVAANGLLIGGLGGAVTVAGGLGVGGQVTAVSNGSAATAIRIGSGATVVEIRVGGTVHAEGGGAAGVASRAILIDQGGTVTAVRNSGKITASTGATGSAGAIVDNGGKLALVENSGAIAALGAPLDNGRAVAIDLRANTSGAIVRQTQVGQGAASPSIIGSILFGTGDDLLDLADGEVKGAIQFGAGANRLAMSGDATYAGSVQFGAGADRLTLAGSSIFAGAADFGGGADQLQLAGTSRFSGSLVNAGNLAVQVMGGTFEVTTIGPVAIGSLAVGAQGVLGVMVDPAAGKSTLFQVAGAASFTQGAKLQVKLTNVGGSVGKFTVLKAGSLTGTSGLTATSMLLPVFLKSSLSANEQVGEIAVTIGRKTAAEIGLNGSETRAWDAMFGNLDKDGKVASAFLGMADTDTFRDAVQQMLPEHSGGLFETVTQGSRASARFLRDPGSPLADMGGWGFWLQQVGWRSTKDVGDTASYDITGWGASAGAEVKLGGAGNVGASLGYLNGRDENGDNANEVSADQFELAGYWRGNWGPLSAHARASAATVAFEGTRTFTGKAANEVVTRTAVGEWDGQLYSLAAGLSYELNLGRLSLRPSASLDYYSLSEDGYFETGGGIAIDLVVEERTSDELVAEATLTAGYDFGSTKRDQSWFRAEIEGGRRQIVAGSIGETIARFGNGSAFTLLPEAREDGWVGRVRLLGGNSDFSIGGEFGAEGQQGQAGISLRVGVQAKL